MSLAKIVGILNVTPDSFSKDGVFSERLEARMIELMEEGAEIIDVGGESTAPGAEDVSVDDELDRLVGVFEIVSELKEM